MTMQNPYQAPQAVVAEPFAADAGIEQVASAQKLIIYAILGYFAAVALQGVLGLFAALLLVLVVCAALVGTFKLCTGMGFSMASRVILLVLMFVPLVSLIVLLVLNAKATARLRAAGYHVGLLGARR
jgi:FtsH-binding integral membrane protein